MAHTRPGKRRDGPPGLPGGGICPFESSLGVAWQTVYQKFSHSTTLTPPIVSDPRPEAHDNHWFDGVVGCAVAASMCGCVLAGTDTAQARKPAKPKVKLSELRKTRNNFG